MISYRQFIDDLNNSIIIEASFEVVGYPHYKNCKIFRKNDTLTNGNIISLIRVELTKDNYEVVSFMDEFDESNKLFHMGKKGAFTLQQIWQKIKLKDVIRKE